MIDYLYFGIVEDVDDPLQAGRVRVRVYGVHSQSRSDIPTEALRWSTVCISPNNAGFRGLGWSPNGIVVGSTVICFFKDGDDKQEPVVLAVYHGFNQTTGEHDVNARARGEIIDSQRRRNEDQTSVESNTVELDEVEIDPSDWMNVAYSQRGVKEFVNGSNPQILRYHDETLLNASDDNTPWCSAFVNWVMRNSKTPIQGTRSAAARSWVEWGAESDYVFGAIIVITRGNTTWQGHVGFLTKWDENSVWILGGNQSDAVNVRRFDRSRVLSLRFPRQEDALVNYDKEIDQSGFSEKTVGPSDYPFNRVFQSMSGHLIEIDDTPNNTRINHQHRTGSYQEFADDGTLTVKSVLDMVSIAKMVKHQYVGLNYFTTVENRYNIKSKSFEVEAESVGFIGPTFIGQLSVGGVAQGWIQNSQFATNASQLGGSPASAITSGIDNALLRSSAPTTLSIQDGEPVNPSIGQIWVDTADQANFVQYKRTVDGWIQDDNPTISFAITDIGAVGGGTKQVFTSAVEPNEPQTNDIWFPESLDDPMIYKAGVWVAATGITIRKIANDTKLVGNTDANEVATKSLQGYENSIRALDEFSKTAAALNGDVQVFYSSTEPPIGDQGDYWVDTSDENRLYIRNNGQWVIDNSDIGPILANLNDLDNGKSTSYFRTTDPQNDPTITLVEGDIWFDTDADLTYRWDGSDWNLVLTSGDSVDGGTLTNTGLTTSDTANAAKIEITKSPLEFAFDNVNDSSTVVRLATIGGNTGPIVTLGSITSARVALQAESKVNANAGLEVSGTASFNDDVELKDTVTVTNGTTLNGTLTANSTSSFNDDVTVDAGKLLTLTPIDTTDANFPSATSNNGSIIMIIDSGDLKPAYSNGTNWLAFSDNGVIV